MNDQISQQLDSLLASQKNLEKSLEAATKPGDRTGAGIFSQGAPAARVGEDPCTSRGFQFSRVIGVLTGKLDKSHAKVEAELCDRIKKEYVERGMYSKHEANSIVVPLSTDLMVQSDPTMEKFAGEVAQIVKAGVAGYQRDEMAHAISRNYNGGVNKALSWLEDSGMGVFVGPPVMGEPIELLRNQEVFMKAGARVVPFPPSGRIVWPRFTGSTTGYWVGSGANDRTLTSSAPTTSDLVLQVKKLGVLCNIPNELFRFPTVSVEQVIRMDMMKTASLTMDKAFIQGVGSAVEPKGLINYDNVNSYTAGGAATNGDSLDPEDVMKIVATVEEQNIDFGCWVGRPLLYAGLANKRADAAMPGDKKGMFLFNMLRDGQGSTADVTNNSVGKLEGYNFFKSNQIPKDRSKGSSSTLTMLLGGQWEQYMIALSGVMEIMVTQVGSTFESDQSQIRLITWCDGAPRYESAFIKVDTLLQNG